MDRSLAAFLVVIALLTGLPGWLTASIIRKHALQAGESPNEWIPFSLLPFAVARFQHPQRALLVSTYLLMNLVSWAAVIVLLVLYISR